MGAELAVLLPGAEWHHIGATAVPGALTKGDVDILLRLPRADFPGAVEALRRHFATKQPDNWTPEFASFGADAGYGLPLGVQVVVRDSPGDFLLFLRDYLATHGEALAEYNRVKSAHAADGPAAYWNAKDTFLARILAHRDSPCTKAG